MNKMIDLLKKYRMRSVFFSYFKMLLVVMLIVFIVSNLILYGYYVNNQRADMENFLLELLHQTGASVDSVIGEADKYYSFAVNNAYVQQFLLSAQAPVYGEYYRSKVLPVYYTFIEFVNASNYVEAIYLCSFGNNYVLSNKNGGNIENFYETEWLKHYLATDEEYFIIISESASSSRAISVCHKLQNNGLLVVQINLNKLREIIKGDSAEYTTQFTASNLDGRIFFSTETENMGRNIDEILPDETTFEEITGSGSDYIYIKEDKAVVCTVSDKGVVYSMDIETVHLMNRNLTGMKNLLIGSTIVILFLVIFLSFYVATRIYKSIADIISIFSKVDGSQNGMLNEMLFISKNIFRILEKQEQTEKELAERLSMLRKAQDIALQTQIAPHFLFNTLQAINFSILADVKADNEATRLLSLLRDLLKITFDTKENIVPVSLEIEHAQKYLEIQSIKYGGIHTVVWEVEDGVKNYYTTKLILQPILENAIEYAFDGANDDEDGIERRITIRAYAARNKLMFEVEDNGKGINEDALNSINKSISDEKITESRHIGIANVSQRLKLAFGMEYGIAIEPGKNGGTCVKIFMPLITET